MVGSKGTATEKTSHRRGGRAKRLALARRTIGSALQLGWLPVACFATGADWVALPLAELNPLLGFLIACAVVCGLSFKLFPSFDERPRWVLVLEALALVLGSVLAVLGSQPTALGPVLLTMAFALLGAACGLGAIMWERTLAGCTRKEAAVIVAVVLTVYALGYSVSAHIDMLASVLAGATASLLSLMLWEEGPLPVADAEVKRTRLFVLERRKLLARYAAAFFVLGACSSVMLGLFVSGIPTAPEMQVADFAVLGVLAVLAGLGIGWLRKREFDFLFSFALLMLFAVATFFPINPGTKLNQHLSLVLGECWIVALYGSMLLVSWSVDTTCARIGECTIGLGLFGLFAGFSVGAMGIGAVTKSAWFCEVVRSSHDGIVFVTTCGLLAMAASYVCTNMLINKNALRTVELLAKGRFASSLPPLGATPARDERDGEVPASAQVDLTARCRDIALEKGLTPREFEVLAVLAHGNSLARVQSELVISEGTAITHRRNIYRKLDVHSKQELLDYVLEGAGDRV